MSALLTASQVGYTILRVAGAAYMIYLGSKMIWGAFRRKADESPERRETPATFWSTFGRGLFTNLLNPKVGAFYVAVLPQFIPAGESPLLVGVLLALVHDVEGILWFTAIILGAGALRGHLARPRVRAAVDGSTGAVLLGFGAKLGLASR